MKATGGVCIRLVLMIGIFGAAAGIGFAAQQTMQRRGTMREGPGSFFPVVAKLEEGTSVDVNEVRGTWLSGRTGQNEGWLPRSAFKRAQAGVDYAGLIDSDKAVVISSVDIAAATKGAFETSYSENHDARFELVDILEQLQIDPMQVSSLLNTLTPAVRSPLRSLPRSQYDNNVILHYEAEYLLGRAMTASLVTPGFTDNQNVTEYVNAVAAVVAAQTPRYDIPFRVAVVKDDTVNGFGLPGGFIVITEGLLRSLKSEAELACQLAHEMAHICLFHGLREFNKRSTHRKSDSAFAELEEDAGGGDDPFAELNELTGETTHSGIEQDLSRLANTSYLKIIGSRAREDELEADLYGVAYAASAGYDPSAMVAYLERVQSRGDIRDAFRHHPAIADRVKVLKAAIRSHRLAQKGQAVKADRFNEQIQQAKASAGTVE
jgi:uncharacterized protein YraI